MALATKMQPFSGQASDTGQSLHPGGQTYGDAPNRDELAEALIGDGDMSGVRLEDLE